VGADDGAEARAQHRARHDPGRLCPSGNISNFLVNYARGNTALSVTIAAFSMLGSILFTPFNLAFWGN